MSRLSEEVAANLLSGRRRRKKRRRGGEQKEEEEGNSPVEHSGLICLSPLRGICQISTYLFFL